ncbi:restriction endonuclease subunit S [Curtobacterium sp. MCBD17_008]|uniref:restriction endonuclease subunit S n=1 Tax=Curtobacterium sp. MCBD17_008 TaxID=2175656 RepID=UPI000DA6DC99|nr:restriction endonuclease subunit S [Curtobacterium sp. MCBD17_008]PZE95219.1 restriction endonuclease subunit S [Curtobacterium sp. MCBD17_008]
MSYDEWDWVPLGSLFAIDAGKTMTAAAREGEVKTRFLRTSNVLWDRIDLTRVDEMAVASADLAAKYLKSGDMLVCEGGDIGRAAIWEGGMENVTFQNHLHRLRPKRDDVIPRFYVYFLQAAFTQLGLFQGAGNRTTIPNLSSSRLAALSVPHPSKPEQEAIVVALRSAHDSIELHGQIAGSVRELKAALMERAFRTGLRGVESRETEIGLMPDAWIVEELGAQHSVSTGATPSRSKEKYWGGEIPWVKTAEVDYSTITSTSECITAAALADTSVRMYPAGTLLMAMYGQGVTRGKVAKLGINATCNQACAAIQPIANRVDGDYLRYFLEWRYEDIRGKAHGGQQQNLNLDIVRALVIAYPEEVAEQREIVDLLSAIDAVQASHRGMERLATELFQSLLFNTMTGGFVVAAPRDDPERLEALA